MPRFTRCEIYDGPDGAGKYRYALFWTATYHPGHPDGENALRERGQHFRAELPEKKDVVTWDDQRKRRETL
jgi:hypothetical protein